VFLRLPEKYLATGKSPRITPENPLPDNAPFKAYVQRLPPTVSDQQLRSWFKLPTKRLHIHVPKPFPNQLAIAYVTFDSRAELEDFVRRNGEPFGGAEWAGWHLDVMVADTPEQAAERKAKFNKYNPRTDNPAQRTDKQPAAKARQYSAR
jgi:hypothetical protein